MGFAVAGVVVIVSLGLAWLSFKTWRIAQVLAMFFIIIASGFFFYLSVMALRTHKAWKEVAAQREKELETELTLQEELKEGVAAEGAAVKKGIHQLKQELYKVQVERGGVYYNVQLKTRPDPANGNVTVTIENPDPHSLLPKVVLFVFDEAGADVGGKFVGEFKVTATPEMSKDVEMTPNLPLPPERLQALSQSNGPWTMYLTMPVDNPAAYAHLDDAAKRTLLSKLQPADLDAYLKADRPLRDYEFAYHEYQLKIPQLQERQRRLTADNLKVEDAVKKAQTEVTYRQAEKAKLENDLAEFKKEVVMVAKYVEKLTQQYAEVRNTIRNVYFENKQLAEELVATQLKAAEEVNRRTGVPLSAVGP